MLKTLSVTAFAFLLPLLCTAEKMHLLDFDKGELPSDTVNCDATLVKENAATPEGYTLKLDFKSPQGEASAGEYKPKKSAWKGFKKLKFTVFNPSGNAIKQFGFYIKGAKLTNDPDNRKDFKLELPVGKSEHSFNLPGILCNDGKTALDISNVFVWKFKCTEKRRTTVYAVDIWLE